MKTVLDGDAIVYCEGAFTSTNGKTAHGLVRRTNRYRVLSVVDSTAAGQDAGKLLDGQHRDIPILATVTEAVDHAVNAGRHPTHLIVGLAPDGGRLDPSHRARVLEGIAAGLNVDSGLHDFLSEDPEFVEAVQRAGVSIRDIRKPPHRQHLHFFSGKIEQVTSLKIAVLGTDSAVGKRTTAWFLVDALDDRNLRSELVGTGQTAWLQGAEFSIILDSLVNDFVSGELEHAVWSAWNTRHPDVILIEGQGSLMNPAYPGGFEILAAGRPDAVVLQHAPGRKEYDGFPGFPLDPIEKQIEAIELISGKPVVAITLNRENLEREQVRQACRTIEASTGLPTVDAIDEGVGRIAETFESLIRARF